MVLVDLNVRATARVPAGELQLCDGNEKSKPVTALPELPQLAQKDKSGQVAKKAKLITATLTCFGVQIAAAIKRDIYFESTYTPCGKNVVFSSGATRDILLRSPYDVISIELLPGLNKCRGIKGGVQMDDTEDVAMEETYRVG
ncbi:hypothetical protein PInf_003660 [Phytophthora infestans]|nr:hypothetical protein PInf_028076 [Phytophthora infestans]KAI9998988.1 hypothetical protein PInf_003660 [Phytophthora infestans]